MYVKMLQQVIKVGKQIARQGLRRPAPGRSPLDEGLGVTIRFAYPDDAAAVRHLAALDSKPVPSGPLLVAEVAGELWAAVSVAGEAESVADPFRHTAELVELLRDRAERLSRPPRQAAAQQPLRTRPVYD